MLFIKTLICKRYFTKPNGDTVLDLTISSIDKTAESPTEVSVTVVDQDNVMRPDIIAKKAYGDDGKLDFLLKYNGISNPFSIEPGDVLIIPEPYKMDSIIRTPDADEDYQYKTEIPQFNYIDQATKAADDKRLDLLAQKARNRELLPPNVNAPGDTNIKYRDGKIIFGEDVTKVSDAKCPETVTRAKLKEKLMRSQIFNKQ